MLLTHDHHGDNLDAAGRALLPRRRARASRRSRARSGSARTGLAPWERTTLSADGRPEIEVTATPCRHGPPGFHPIVGDVIGFALRWEGGSLWITGDTVLYGGVRDAAARLEPDVVLLHLGAVRFGVTGPLHYTLTAPDAVDALRPRGPARRRAGALRGLVALLPGPGGGRAGVRGVGARRPLAAAGRAGHALIRGARISRRSAFAAKLREVLDEAE